MRPLISHVELHVIVSVARVATKIGQMRQHFASGGGGQTKANVPEQNAAMQQQRAPHAQQAYAPPMQPQQQHLYPQAVGGGHYAQQQQWPTARPTAPAVQNQPQGSAEEDFSEFCSSFLQGSQQQAPVERQHSEAVNQLQAHVSPFAMPGVGGQQQQQQQHLRAPQAPATHQAPNPFARNAAAPGLALTPQQQQQQAEPPLRATSQQLPQYPPPLAPQPVPPVPLVPQQRAEVEAMAPEQRRALYWQLHSSLAAKYLSRCAEGGRVVPRFLGTSSPSNRGIPCYHCVFRVQAMVNKHEEGIASRKIGIRAIMNTVAFHSFQQMVL